MRTFGNPVNYDLENDRIVHKVNVPTFMTDRRREELRITKDGYYYLHTDNDREDEMIITTKIDIEAWIEQEKVNLAS